MLILKSPQKDIRFPHPSGHDPPSMGLNAPLDQMYGGSCTHLLQLHLIDLRQTPRQKTHFSTNSGLRMNQSSVRQNKQSPLKMQVRIEVRLQPRDDAFTRPQVLFSMPEQLR
jgi:hypothetical protein